jgi:Domain of unknown function (DUF305)
MITERETTQIAGQFFAERLNGMLQLVYAGAAILAVSVAILGIGLLRAGAQSATHPHGNQPITEADWSELIAIMDKMHLAMGAIKRSGNSDVDFVRLMLPHHQAAVDMAKTQLLYGKDPQMRRLAQEIITDQQLEIELMQRWLKQQEPAAVKENRTPAPDTRKDN